MKPSILVAVIGLIAAHQAAARDALEADAMLNEAGDPRFVDNAAFVPPVDARPAQRDFVGTLDLSEAPMRTDPETMEARLVLGRETTRFPGVEIEFFSHEDDLVPVSRDVIGYGSAGRGTSYWDVIVQPGRVWSEPGDGDWSRAAFPFALVHRIEGETHNGVASFLYDDETVSPLHFQIVQQTAPYYVTDYFTAWGRAPVEWRRAAPADLEGLKAAYEAELADRLTVRPFSQLSETVDAATLEAFVPHDMVQDVVASGLARDGRLYLKPCEAAAGGELPFCDRQRFGVWSVTKAAANAVALLRLAEKHGEEVFDERLVDHLANAADHDGWEEVTFGDALDMATGIGHGSTETSPNDIGDGYLTGDYAAWYEAPSEAEKVALAFRSADYPWRPGEVARYRDRDMFLLGAAMDAYLKAKEGPGADLWRMVAEEVYAPIGVHHAPMNRTIEPDGSMGQAMMAYGWYPTLDDIAKVGRLLHDGGAHDGRQLLHRGRLEELLPGPQERGLPTGDATHPRYHMAFWHALAEQDGCARWLPEMRGWGGNLVSLAPGGVTTFRIAKNWDGEGDVTDTSGMHAVAAQLGDFCGQEAARSQ